MWGLGHIYVYARPQSTLLSGTEQTRLSAPAKSRYGDLQEGFAQVRRLLLLQEAGIADLAK